MTRTSPRNGRLMPLLAGLILLSCQAGARAAGEVQPTSHVPMAEGWRKTTLIKELEHSRAMAFLPDGGLLVTERPGRLRLVRDGKLQPEPIQGMPEVLARNQGGLLDLVLHPDHAQNRLIYFTYAAGEMEANQTTLARAVLDGRQVRDVRVLFQAEPKKRQARHFGSRVVWLPDGTLLMSIGDGGNPPLQIDGTLARDHGQRLDSHLGKILRPNDDGTVPQDNPFVGRPNVRPEIFSYGHRNVQGMTYDPDSRRIWINDHGPLGGDDLNLVEAGANYGWPLATYDADYRTGQRFTPHRTFEGAIPPKAVWTPAVAPSGPMVHSGDRFPQWRGRLFSGGLVGQDIRVIQLDGARVTGQQAIPIASRVRCVTQGPDDLIYVLIDEDEGELIRIEPQEGS